MGFLDILKQYAEPGSQHSGDVFGHFDAVAQQATSQQLGSGIAAALRSDATPAFGQTIGNLFGQSNPEQKAGLLNEIVKSLGPAPATTGGGILGGIVGTNPPGANALITPAQAAQSLLPPSAPWWPPRNSKTALLWIGWVRSTPSIRR